MSMSDAAARRHARPRRGDLAAGAARDADARRPRRRRVQARTARRRSRCARSRRCSATSRRTSAASSSTCGPTRARPRARARGGRRRVLRGLAARRRRPARRRLRRDLGREPVDHLLLDLGLRADRAARRPRRSRPQLPGPGGRDRAAPVGRRAIPRSRACRSRISRRRPSPRCCVCAAWAKRLQTGEGERIDVAMADVVASWVGPHAGTEMRGPRRAGCADHPATACSVAADGAYVTLAVISEDHFWRGACAALELTALRDLDYASRLDRIAECNAALGGALARHRPGRRGRAAGRRGGPGRAGAATRGERAARTVPHEGSVRTRPRRCTTRGLPGPVDEPPDPACGQCPGDVNEVRARRR